MTFERLASIVAVMGIFALAPKLAEAQSTTVFIEQGQLVRASQNVTALGADLMGDKVNLYTGALEVTQTDVSLPGNNALPVSVGRRYVAGIPRISTAEGLFVDWDIEIPHLHGIYAAGSAALQGWVVWASAAGPAARKRCSNFQPPPDAATVTHAILEPDEFWGGHFLYAPGSGDEKMLKRDPANTTQPADGFSYPIVTKSNWQFRCITGLASPKTANGTEPDGDGFVAISPDGTQYRFDWIVSRPYRVIANSTGGVARQEVWILPTLVTDRFGNTVTYQYDTADPWKLNSIAASDGRAITLSYSSGHRVASINDGTRTWSYGYNNNAAGTQASRLISVTLPDGSAWGFDIAEQSYSPVVSPLDRCSGGTYSDGTLTPNTKTNTITHPSGAVGSFVMSYVMHGRSGMSAGPTTPCPGWKADWPTPAYGVRSLISKTISGPGIPGLTWTFAWGPANGSLYCTGTCPTNKSLILTDPRGFATRYTFGNYYQVTEGQLQQVDEGWNGSTALRTTLSAYRVPGAGPYPTDPGYSGSESGDDLMQTRYLPLVQQVILQQGASFTWVATGFDTLARVTSASRSSSLGYSKADSTAFADNTSKWVLGQLASQTVGAVVASSTSFDPVTALPTASYQFGKLKASYAFNADGTLRTVTDGLNHTTTYSNYKRGLAQNTAYADGSTESAAVNNLGLVTSLTNGAGTTTSYGYDPMGRLSLITPPGGDPVAYNPMTIAYQQVPGDEYGLAAGHWRQTIATGTGVTTNYFDAMLRKRVSTTLDANNPSGTQRAQLFNFDADHRNVFTSYPARSIASINIAPAGTATLFDALGRVYQTNADSELGVLTTSSQYLSGFQRQVTNPRGYATTTSFQAFDQPSESAPVAVTGPESLNLAISRDTFGKPLSVTRSGPFAGSGPASVTRSYVYDPYQLLCKTIEPEIGATIQSLDGANNVAWRATGLSLTSTSSCDTAGVPAARKVAYTYDARNRVTGTGFGDGSPSIGRSYTSDGLPATVVSNGSTLSYSYNNRRLLTFEMLDARTLSSGWIWGFTHACDANGHESQLYYPDGAVYSYVPNALGEPTTVSGYANNVTYQPNGAIAGYALTNGIAHTQSQNARGLPLQNIDAGVLQDQYGYDANGNVAAIADQLQGVSSRSMGYDGLDRLTAANAPGVWGNASYGYDALDNLGTSVVGSRNSAHNYDANNRLGSLNINGAYTAYAYDVQGNITGRGTQGFYFDQGNRMTLANGKASYVYDGLGRRILTTGTDGQVMLSYYGQSGQLLFAQHQQGGAAQNIRHIYLGGKQIAEVDSTYGTSFFHTDALGSPVAKTNASGALVSRTRYEPYGNTAAGTVPNGIGFTGHVNDANTGLVYMQQRYYDPIAARFLSIDPITTDANMGTAFNRFNYAQNNPYRYTDPDGRKADSDPCAGNGNCTVYYFGSGGVSQSTRATLVAAGGFLGGSAGATFAGGCALTTGGLCGLGAPAIVGAGIAGGALLGNSAANLFDWISGLITSTSSNSGQATSPVINPSDVAGKTPGQIDQLATGAGLKPKGPDPQNGRGAYVDPVTGEQRILVHGDHAHVNNAAGNRLDVNGNVVPSNSPAAHLPIGTP